MKNSFDVSKKYRTVHSIKDDEILSLLPFINENVKIFCDYGCHFGHLSIELAINNNMDIYSVDNFTGSFGDDLMKRTIDEKTNNAGNFFNNFLDNVNEAESLVGGFQGRIHPIYSEDFYDFDEVEFDMVFIDSSHRVEEYKEFEIIYHKVKSGGIIGGHDFHHPGVVKGRELLSGLGCSFISKPTHLMWFMKKD